LGGGENQSNRRPFNLRKIAFEIVIIRPIISIICRLICGYHNATSNEKKIYFQITLPWVYKFRELKTREDKKQFGMTIDFVESVH